MTLNGYRVTEEIQGAKPDLLEYPLLPGDLLTKQSDGTYFKECPGVAVGGFLLSEDQEAALETVKFMVHGLDYQIVEESA